jgi:hypothetical protein
MNQTQQESARRRTAELAAERYSRMPAWPTPKQRTTERSKKHRPVAVAGYELYLAAKEAAALRWVGDGLDSPDPQF